MSEHKFPTEVIDLPSQGKVYPKDSPLADGKVELKYMTTKEEDILMSQNLIKKGVVIDKLIDSLIVTKGVNQNDLDISLQADNVLVSGKIDIQYGFESISDDIVTDLIVELIPAADEGYERENVEISIEINDDGEIIWNATVAPGKWVFHAESPNYHMVVYDAFEAEIIDGGVHNTTIKAGGYLPISTRWTDFSGDERDILTLESTNSTITNLVPLTLTLNEAKWNITVSETAEIWLLPAGSLQISGEFTVLEMDMDCLLYTSPSPRDRQKSRMPSSA